jgi:hypothetical protein
VSGLFTLVLGMPTVAFKTYKFWFMVKNSPIGQYATSVSMVSTKTPVLDIKYTGQQMYPTIGQWGEEVPGIATVQIGTLIAPQKVDTGTGYKAPMLICGFLPRFDGYPSNITQLFQSTPSSNVSNTFNLTFSFYCTIENSSALTLSGLSNVLQSDGPLAHQSTLCYFDMNKSQVCNDSSNILFSSEPNGSAGYAIWKGASYSVIFYVLQSIAPTQLISIMFNLINPRYFNYSRVF